MQDNYTPQELNEQKGRIKDDLLVSAAPDAYPHAYLLAGQPGVDWQISVHVHMAEISSLFQAMITAGIILVSLICKYSTVMMLSSIHSSLRGR